ncbi:MAG: hypothetical protein OXM56_01085 [Gammaproteobacteria bacterium]|nr:hypothetical protein [Gammaproteobacteria bacterium]
MAEAATDVPQDASRDVPNAVDAMLAPVRELGLAQYVAELEQYGYTVIPPERVAAPEFVERVRAAVLRVAHERTGVEDGELFIKLAARQTLADEERLREGSGRR